MEVGQLKFNCTECNFEAIPAKGDGTTYTVKCSNKECSLSIEFVQPRIVNLSLALGTLEDNLRDYFSVEKLW